MATPAFDFPLSQLARNGACHCYGAVSIPHPSHFRLFIFPPLSGWPVRQSHQIFIYDIAFFAVLFPFECLLSFLCHIFSLG